MPNKRDDNDMDDWEGIAKAHQALFDEVRPAATLIEVSRLIDSEMLVEIEVDAVIAAALS